MYMEKLNVHFLLSEYRDIYWIFDFMFCGNIVLDINEVKENMLIYYITRCIIIMTDQERRTILIEYYANIFIHFSYTINRIAIEIKSV